MALISSCGIDSRPPRLPTKNFSAWLGDGDDLVRHKRVVHKRVGLGQRGQHVERQQAGIARTGAGQPDMAGLEHRLAVIQAGNGLFETLCAPLSPMTRAFAQAYRSRDER